MTVRRAAVPFVAMLIAGAVIAPLAAAGRASSEPDGALEALAVRKTVTARADATGAVQQARMHTLLDAAGRGAVTVTDPTSTEGLRDLDALWKPRTRGRAVIWDLDLDGQEVRHSTARHAADDLPLVIAARYLLDGEPVHPDELAGASGDVTARFFVRNLTAERRLITYQTADGEETERIAVAVPLVARLVANFGPSWRDLRSDLGALSVDADGMTLVWTMALFEPLGALVQELEVTATLEAGALPDVVLEAAPVTTADSPQLVAGRQTLTGAQSDGVVLTYGLEEIDDALAMAAYGVRELLDGLTEMGAGAGELAAGLGEAADGARELADGLGGLAQSTDALSAGLGELAGGSGELADAVAQLADGSHELAQAIELAVEGVEELDDGIEQLADEGVDLMHDAAGHAAASAARDLARIEALEARALEGVPHGVPEGAQASAAYRITLAGAQPFGLPAGGRVAGGLILLTLAGALAHRTGQNGSAATEQGGSR